MNVALEALECQVVHQHSMLILCNHLAAQHAEHPATNPWSMGISLPVEVCLIH